MAVFHYCANIKRDGRTDVLDGLIETDGAPQHMDKKWFQDLREAIAANFYQPANPRWVQITSLTRIGG